jgi:hypothetical protein
MSPYAPRLAALAAGAVVLFLGACGKQGAILGEGGSIVTGSAGPAGAESAARELVKCDAPVATLALIENPNGYTVVASNGLPASPLPLVRLLAQQSGCFRVVDRSAGLRATVQEQELKNAGIVRQNSTVAKGYEAQYSLTPSLTFSERDARCASPIWAWAAWCWASWAVRPARAGATATKAR